MAYKTTHVPPGEPIVQRDGQLLVPDVPIIPFIRGDGIGPDIWRTAQPVFDVAVAKAYGGRRHIAWMEVFAGETAFTRFKEWLPEETVTAFAEFMVGIKGPLTTPVGGGIRSLNVALRQQLDLYVCLRPVRHLTGVPSPVKSPELVNVVVFRENTEDIYAGIEFAAGTPEARQVLAFLEREFPQLARKIRFGREAPEAVGIGFKPVSRPGTERLVRAALDYALRHKRRSVTLVHKGNIMKFTEGAFRDWGFQLARREYGAVDHEGGPWQIIRPENLPARVPSSLRVGAPLIVKDAIADITLQQVLTRPADFEVIATLNLNGDYLSDALAAQVGGIGIAPGGNINYQTGHAIFEATHGTAPKYAGKDMVNPGSLILSGAMMLEHLGWQEAADLVVAGLERTIASKHVTYDFARLMEGATQVRCSEFGNRVIENMQKV